MARRILSRRSRIAVPIAVVLATGAGLAACGSSNDAASTTTTTSTTVLTSIKDQVDQLTTAAGNLKNATFGATYSLTQGTSTQDVTYGQSPPKYLFKLGDGTLALDDGTSSYYCNSSKTCVGLTSASPIAAQLALFNGSTFITVAQGFAKAKPALDLLGVDVTFSSASYAGIASSCMTVTYTRNGATSTYCVASDTGLLTYWKVDATTYELTSYTKSPPDSYFTLPDGYTTVSIP
jgi:hypothetical protein